MDSAYFGVVGVGAYIEGEVLLYIERQSLHAARGE